MHRDKVYFSLDFPLNETLMSRLRTPLEVYKLLPRSNCGECPPRTCMAFAAAVIKQEAQLSGCPRLDKKIISEYSGKIDRQVNLESVQQEQLKKLQKKIRTIELPSRVECLCGRVNDSSLVISCLGRDFEVDAQGTVRSQCHTHAWFSLPLLDYVVNCTGAEVTGNWVPLRELPSGQTWSRLFEQRCEKPLKQIADRHAALFEDLISMFSAVSSFNDFNADISVVLYPLPRVPILICYWKPEEDMESKLHVFFDESAEKNLPIDSLFTLGTGIAMMLQKIMLKHSGAGSLLP